MFDAEVIAVGGAAGGDEHIAGGDFVGGGALAGDTDPAVGRSDRDAGGGPYVPQCEPRSDDRSTNHRPDVTATTPTEHPADSTGQRNTSPVRVDDPPFRWWRWDVGRNTAEADKSEVWQRCGKGQSALSGRCRELRQHVLLVEGEEPFCSGPTWCTYTSLNPAAAIRAMASRWRSGSGPQVTALATWRRTRARRPPRSVGESPAP
jgi:hypothetical protein